MKSSPKFRKLRAIRLLNKKEEQLIVGANLARTLARLPRTASSGVSARKRRSDPLVDRAALEILDKKLASSGHFGFTSSPPRLVPVRTHSQLVKIKRWGAKHTLARKARHIVSRDPNASVLPNAYLVHAPIWDHTSEIWKTLAYVTCIARDQRIAFTLRLTPAVALLALKSRRGPAQYLQDRIASKIRDSFPDQSKPSFLMSLECTGDGWGLPEDLGLHIHGVLDLPHCDRQTPIRKRPIELLKEALRLAGGDMKGPARARMVMARTAFNPVGWTAYIGKHRLSTSAAIQAAQRLLGIRPSVSSVPLLAVTVNLRRQAQIWYNTQRNTEDLTWVGRKKGFARVDR